MNLVVLPPDQRVADDVWELGERYARQARKIWKRGPGDVVRVGELDGRIGTARIVSVDHHRLRLEVVRLDDDPPPPLAIELALALALPRPPILRRCLQQATALGVKRFVLFHSARVERSYWSSGELEPLALREQLVLGLEQAGDTVLPEVRTVRRFRELVESLGRDDVVADPTGDRRSLPAAEGPRRLVIGPEGGFIAPELDAFRERGARILGLGPRILRVDTACVSLLGRYL